MLNFKMKFMKFNYYNMLLVMLLMASCSKKMDVGGAPDWTVGTESSSYKVGEEITFTFQGHADLISFCSGEDFNDYAFKDGRVVDVATGGVKLDFRSSVQNGEQTDQLSVWASTDFNGGDDLASIKAATWTDITDRFTLGTSSTFIESTTQDLSDLAVKGKPLYIAFKYLTKPQKDNGLSSTWYIESFALTSGIELGGAPLLLTDQVNAGFKTVAEDPENTPVRTSISATRITMIGNIYKDPADPMYDPENPIFDPENPIYDPESDLYDPDAVRPEFVPYDPASPYNDPLREHWVVSKGISLTQVDLGPDWSNPIKGISNSKMEEFTYTYTEPGTYKAYFVASNTNIDDSKQIVREITITITE